MKSVYILLSRTNTYFARLIHRVTGDSYTHSAIGLDGSFNCFYSFARRYVNFPFLAGFMIEDVNTGVYAKHKNSPCILVKLDITDEVYEEISQLIASYIKNRRYYHYNFLGLFYYIMKKPCRRERHYVCSQFVAHILDDSKAAKLPKDPSLMKPVDFLKLPITTVYTGPLKGCVPPIINTACLAKA